MDKIHAIKGPWVSERENTVVSNFITELSKKGVAPQSVIVYGSVLRDDFVPKTSDINLLVIVPSIDKKVLDKVSGTTKDFIKKGIAPLFLTKKDLILAEELFSLKFLTIKVSHQLIFGRDILGKLWIKEADLLYRCKQELLNSLLKLRRTYLIKEVSKKSLTSTINSFVEVMRVLVSVNRKDLVSREEALTLASKKFEFDPLTIRKILALKSGKNVSDNELSQLYLEYLTIIDNILSRFD
jgi:predicted nucleotidyltransferase